MQSSSMVKVRAVMRQSAWLMPVARIFDECYPGVAKQLLIPLNLLKLNDKIR